MDVETALAEINGPFTGELPVEAIRALQASPAECTPRLIEIIREATAQVQAGEELPGNGQLIAAYLLTEFQATEALPTLVEAISLPEEQLDELFGDMITEDLCRMLAVLDAKTLEATDSLITNPHAYQFVRSAALRSYFLRAKDGLLSREDVLRRWGPQLKSVLDAEDDEGIENFAGYLEDCGEVEYFNEISKAHVRGVLDEATLDQALTQAMAKGDGTEFERYVQRTPPTGIEDTVQELSYWASYNSPRDDSDLDDSPEFRAQWEEAKRQVLGRIDPPVPPLPPPGEPIRYEGPRTGRNDPCPCGSGKKYKKCCARA